MIEEISLPVNAGYSRRHAFEITKDFGEGILARNSNQRVQVIRHQQEQSKMPALTRMISACGFENYCGFTFMAELVSPPRLTTNRDEVDRAEPSGEMRRVIEVLSEGLGGF